MRTFIKKLFDAADITTAVDSSSFNCGESVLISTQYTTTGTAPTGTLKLQSSNDNVNWVDIPTASASISSVTTGVIPPLVDYAYLYIRAVWTQTSGTGTISATIVAKGP